MHEPELCKPYVQNHTIIKDQTGLHTGQYKTKQNETGGYKPNTTIQERIRQYT